MVKLVAAYATFVDSIEININYAVYGAAWIQPKSGTTRITTKLTQNMYDDDVSRQPKPFGGTPSRLLTPRDKQIAD